MTSTAAGSPFDLALTAQLADAAESERVLVGRVALVRPPGKRSGRRFFLLAVPRLRRGYVEVEATDDLVGGLRRDQLVAVRVDAEPTPSGLRAAAVEPIPDHEEEP